MIKHRYAVAVGSLLCLGFLGLTACTHYSGEVYSASSAQSPNRIRIACGEGCTTLNLDSRNTELTDSQRAAVRYFVHSGRRAEPIYIAPCDVTFGNPNINWPMVHEVKQEVRQLGYKARVVRPVLPEERTNNMCINLVRGKLKIVPPQCPNLWTHPDVVWTSSNFGCATNRNFAMMVVNPRDLLAGTGDISTEGTLITQGNANYNEGKKTKLNDENVKV